MYIIFLILFGFLPVSILSIISDSFNFLLEFLNLYLFTNTSLLRTHTFKKLSLYIIFKNNHNKTFYLIKRVFKQGIMGNYYM